MVDEGKSYSTKINRTSSKILNQSKSDLFKCDERQHDTSLILLILLINISTIIKTSKKIKINTTACQAFQVQCN